MAFVYKTEEIDGKKFIAMNDKGYPIIFDDEEGDNPKEIDVDAIHLYTEIPNVRNSLKQANEEKEKYKEYVKALKDSGIEVDDMSKFNESLEELVASHETVKNLKDHKLVKANEVESIKKQAREHAEDQLKKTREGFETQLKEKDETILKLDDQLSRHLIDNSFDNSKFVREKIAVPLSLFKSQFRGNFKVEEDEDKKVKTIRAYNSNGDRIYSPPRPGEDPTFDEALEVLVNEHEDAKLILKGDPKYGGGADGPGGKPGSRKSIAEQFYGNTM